MTSVTQRIKQIKQPYGGYIKPKSFQKKQLDDLTDLFPSENISGNLVGLVIDYMTRFQNGADASDAFNISLKGAELLGESELHYAKELLSRIKDIEPESITCAAKLVGYDVIFRSGLLGFKPVDTINPDEKTIANIQTMIKRSLQFIKLYGPITVDGFTFLGGYTPTVSTGDGDFLTADTLWDFKVSKTAITSKHSLQLIMYYLMGKHSINEEFDSITHIGVFNPRLNIVYRLDVSTIEPSILSEIESKVIGY